MDCNGSGESDVFRFLFLFVHIFTKLLEQFLQKLQFVVHNLCDRRICFNISQYNVLFQSCRLTVCFTELHVSNNLVIFIVNSYDLVSGIVDFFVVFVVTSTCDIAESFGCYFFTASLGCVPHFSSSCSWSGVVSQLKHRWLNTVCFWHNSKGRSCKFNGFGKHFN